MVESSFRWFGASAQEGTEGVDIYVVGSEDANNAQRDGRRLRQGILTDTGAGASVADGALSFPEFPNHKSPASEAGQSFLGCGQESLQNRGQRHVKLRLGSEQGSLAGLRFQDAAVRRPILSVGDSTSMGNCFWYDQEGSHVIPRGSPKIAQIRHIIQGIKRKINIRKVKNVFQIDDWVENEAGDFFKRLGLAVKDHLLQLL